MLRVIKDKCKKVIKRLVFCLIPSILLILACLIFLEIYLRLDDILRINKVNSEHNSKMVYTQNRPDKSFGWYPKENYFYNVERYIDFAGNLSSFEYSTNQYGFRKWGDVNSRRKKVMVLGDSFSQAIHIDNSKTYYSLLGEIIEADVFGFGCTGYGTFQEYLVLDKYFELIKPDYVVFQFCGNDFLDNNYELDKTNNRSVGTSYSTKRPFLSLDNSVTLKTLYSRTAIPFPNLWTKLRFRSLFFINSKLTNMLQSNKNVPNEVLEYVARYGYPDYANNLYKNEFNDSYKITENIFRLINEKYGNRTKVIVFSVHDSQVLRKIVEDSGLTFIDIYKDIKDAEEINGTRKPLLRVDGIEGHFNEIGHQVIAESLRDHFSIITNP